MLMQLYIEAVDIREASEDEHSRQVSGRLLRLFKQGIEASF